MIRIATRRSPLALAQANEVATRLRQAGHDTTLVPMTSLADRFLDRPVHALGGKGVFVGILEEALLNDQADLAVHSVKDMPSQLEPTFALPCHLPREDVRDAWIGCPWDPSRPQRAGTGSPRRDFQLRQHAPSLTCTPIRGNIQRRIELAQHGEVDGVILAMAGLKRMALLHHVQHIFETNVCLPAAGQGAIGVECLAQRHDLIALLEPLNDPITHRCVQAERRVNHRLGGHCHAPLATYACKLDADTLQLQARVGCHQRPMLEHALTGPWQDWQQLADTLADALNNLGAQAYMERQP